MVSYVRTFHATILVRQQVGLLVLQIELVQLVEEILHRVIALDFAEQSARGNYASHAPSLPICVVG